ncbi:hypothetical protein DPB93_16220 [Salmonella enterica subsp. salamae]|nr:hypothetical protein [Salmonella enterica subsp. salamae]ECI4077183.1 hypothetical protein [Salmonella enterica subsp. salamae]EEO2381468.1 hypothetical protein [Salmonella enterica]
MDRLIREMSYLLTKKRFMELQERAHEIAMSSSDYPECFGLIVDAIDEFLEELPENLQYHEKPLMHYMVMRSLTLWDAGEKLTNVPWSHRGWSETAEKGDTIQ